jgi:hypothetical protein
MEPKIYDIGGVIELVMVKGAGGYHGHYSNKQSGVATTFSAEGMTKKQIIAKFWDRVKNEK